MTIAASEMLAETGPEDSIRIRIPVIQRVLILLAALVYLFIAVSEVDNGPVIGLFGDAVYGLAALVTIGALTVLQMFFWGIDLTPEGAVVRIWRKRTIPWQEVEGVVAEKVGGTRFVTLILTGARRVEVRAQAVKGFSPSRKYDARFHTVAQYWAAHRGPGQTYYNREIGPYQEAYLTGDLAERLLSLPEARPANTTWVLAQVGAFAVFFIPLITCSIIALVFATSARRRLREHGIPYPFKIVVAFRASIGTLIMCTVLWSGIIALFVA